MGREINEIVVNKVAYEVVDQSARNAQERHSEAITRLEETKVTKSQGIYYFENDFGGVANDDGFDNAPVFMRAVRAMSENNGGILYIGSGTFYFRTSVELTGISNVSIVGFGPYDGTVFKTTGSGTFIKITDMESSCISGIKFVTNIGAITEGLNISNASNSSFSDIRVQGFTDGVVIGVCDNVDFNKCIMVGSENANRVLVIDKNDGLTNVRFLDCSFEGIPNEGFSPSLAEIDGCRHSSFIRCRFAYTNGYGVVIKGSRLTSAYSSISGLLFDSCEFVSVMKCVLLGEDSRRQYLIDIVFRKCDFIFDCTSNDQFWAFYIQNTNTASNIYLTVEQASLLRADGGGGKFPSWALNCSGDGEVIGGMSIARSSFDSYRTLITVPDRTLFYAKYKPNSLPLSGKWELNGGNSAYEKTLTTVSPYEGNLLVTVNPITDPTKRITASCTATLKGKMILKVSFDTAIPSDETFELLYKIDPEVCY